MTDRAAVMAKALVEDWPEGATAEEMHAIMVKRFPNDTMADLSRALSIGIEIMDADLPLNEGQSPPVAPR